ncbi:MAG TPA: sugar ABC transporter permease [Stackebrandtia sp.]|uniref:carbohydrate ABC transporter permease n=1 Tax=Stackebrandtia sp. TaxID=2023065 RepID=UPI002D4A77E0|nr:sugar ABC transporter permease [Stackebrandtia sp.]HZE39079.1 sugar ABC transporter permease [Stackebrandtia sp.]
MSITRRRARSGWGFVLPFAIFFTAFFIIPIVYAVYQSLFKVERTGSLGLSGSKQVFVWFDNYAAALSDAAFVDSLVRILIFAVIQVPVMVILAVALALLLDAASARGVPFFRSAYFLPYGVPGVVASILWGFLYTPGISPIVTLLNDLGLNVDFLGTDNILLSIINIVTWQFAGYNMLVLVAQLKSINPDLYESARMDGAGAWRIVWNIKLPLARPAIVMVTVFTIVGTLQLFSEPLVLKPLTGAINFTYTPNLTAYNEAFNKDNYQMAAAQAVLLAVVAMVFSFGFLRLFGRGDDES